MASQTQQVGADTSEQAVVAGVFADHSAGTAALEIRSVGLKHGKAESEKTTLVPGETSVVSMHSWVPVPYSPASSFGRGVWVESNDPTSPRTILTVVGTAHLPYESVPAELDFGSIPKALAGASRTIDLVSWYGDPIADAMTDGPFAIVKWEKIVVSGGKDRVRVTVRITEPAPVGDLR